MIKKIIWKNYNIWNYLLLIILITSYLHAARFCSKEALLVSISALIPATQPSISLFGLKFHFPIFVSAYFYQKTKLFASYQKPFPKNLKK